MICTKIQLGLVIALASLSLGCTGLRLSGGAPGSLHPVAAIAAAHLRPCLELTDDAPERHRFDNLDGPDLVHGVDENGDPITGIRFTVTADSMKKFFDWIERLQEIAKRARDACVLK